MVMKEQDASRLVVCVSVGFETPISTSGANPLAGPILCSERRTKRLSPFAACSVLIDQIRVSDLRKKPGLGEAVRFWGYVSAMYLNGESIERRG